MDRKSGELCLVVLIEFPPRCLYHDYDELKAVYDTAKREEPDSDRALHLPILLEFIADDTVKEADNLRDRGLITYEHLWTIFRPGKLIYSASLGQPRLYELEAYKHSISSVPSLKIGVNYVNYDGDDFGTRATGLQVPAFDGSTSIMGLRAFPLSFHPHPDEITALLVERGHKWEAHAGQQVREYKGLALATNGSRYNIDGRFMAFPKLKDGKRKQALDSEEMELVAMDEAPAEPLAPLTDEQCLLASPMVRGFSFTEEEFLEFFIDRLSPIDWNTRCFEKLVLPDSQKELVQALVSEHTQRAGDPSRAAFDDIVKGKGRGLILMLYGPPGMGKTLTAECVAEFAHRPLYIVSSGDLGTSSAVLSERLSDALDLASTWKAVLLIDEADVFLERRSPHDMERNGLVSIFLRTLEYYSGILFMTTNRVRTFDDAFKSRIHVPLKYDDLPHASRVLIWRNFLDGVEGGVDVDEAGLEELAEGRLNGRQIKDVVRTAKSLAAHKRRRLDKQQLLQVMDLQKAFEEELGRAVSEVGVAQQR